MQADLNIERFNFSLIKMLSDLQDTKIKDLETELHTLTAKKLPIKKSKNK